MFIRKTRKLLCFALCIAFVIASFTTVFAETDSSEIEYLEDGSYFETIIEEDNPSMSLFSTTKTKSSSKTVYYKNSNNTTLWYVKVNGKFTYNGSTSSCTSSQVTAAAPASTWSVTNKKASKSGSTAKASATGVKKVNGITTQTVPRTVTLTCSKNGNLS